MQTFDFTVDNSGSPDQYTLSTCCNKITIVEKDLTAATLARARVYIPVGASNYIELQPGQTLPVVLRGHPATWVIGFKPFAMETTNVASTVFSVVEELEL
jgi:hypothetical protein